MVRKFLADKLEVIQNCTACSINEGCNLDANRDSTMTIPGLLKSGDTIGVVSPSGSISREKLNPGLNYLKSQGYSVRLGDSVFAEDRYLAGTDYNRAHDLNVLFADSSVNAIFAARGGYGSTRILDKIDYSVIVDNPKILVGFSDTTALQWGVFAETGLVTYTGFTLHPDATDDGVSSRVEDSLWAQLKLGIFDAVNGLRVIKHGSASGPLLAGCLSLVASLVGTRYFPDMAGAILVLEDVNEEPYRIDRMLTQLRLAGVFEVVSGVILGEFCGCTPENPNHGHLGSIIDELVDWVDGPVLAGIPYGHGPDRVVLPIGAAAELTTEEHEGSLLCVFN